MTTPNRMQYHWDQVRAFMKREWPRLSDTALNNIQGDFDKFLFYLRESYSNFPMEEAIARQKLQNFLNRIEDNPQ